MKNNGAANVAMQIIIDQTKLVADATKAMADIKRIFSQPISLEVHGNTNFNAALAAIQRFENAIQRLDARLDGVGDSAEEMAKDTAKAMESSAGAADTAKETIESYGAELQKGIEKQKRLWRTLEAAYEGNASAIAEIEKRVKSGGDKFKIYEEMAKRADARVEELTVALQQLTTAAHAGGEQKAKQAGSRNAEAYVSGFQQKFGATTSDLKILIRADDLIKDVEKAFASKEFYLKINTKALTTEIQEAINKGISFEKIEQNLKQSLVRQAQTLRSFFDGTMSAVGKGSKANPLAFTPRLNDNAFKASLLELYKLMEAMTKQINGGAEGAGIQLKISANKDHLRDSVKAIVRDAEGLSKAGARLRLGVNQPHLLTEVEAAVAYVNKHLNGKINLGFMEKGFIDQISALSKVAAEAAAAAKQYTTGISSKERRELSRIRRQEERNSERKVMVSKQELRDLARTDPEAAVRRIFPNQREMQESVQAIRSMYERGLSPEERKQRTAAALPHVDRIRQGFTDYESSAHSPRQKEMMRVFGQSFSARFVTPLLQRIQQTAVSGPRRNPQGVLSGVDALARDGMLEDWKARATSMRGEITRSAGYLGNYGDSLADPWKLALKSLDEYSNALRRVEKEMAGLATARTTGQEAEQLKRIQGAIGSAGRSEARLVTDALSLMPGTVRTNRVTADDEAVRVGRKATMSKADAYLSITEGLRRSIGSEFEQFNMKNVEQGKGITSFRSFASGLLGGDKQIVTEFLRLRGVSEDVLKDKKLMKAALDTLLGPLTKVKDVWRSIDKEVEQTTRNVGLQREVTQAYKEDRRRASALDKEARRMGVAESQATDMDEKREFGKRRMLAEAYAQDARVDAARRKSELVVMAAYKEDKERAIKKQQAIQNAGKLEAQAYAADIARAKRLDREARTLALAELQAHDMVTKKEIGKRRMLAEAYAADARFDANRRKKHMLEVAAYAEDEARVRRRGVMEDQAYRADIARAKKLQQEARRMGVAESQAHDMNAKREFGRRKMLAEAYAQDARFDAARRRKHLMEVAAIKEDEARTRQRGLLEVKAHQEDVARIRKRGVMEDQAYRMEYQRLRRQQREQERLGRGRGVGGYGNTIRNAAAMFGGIGMGATAAWQIRSQFQQYMGFEDAIAGIQGVLGSKNKFDAGFLSKGIQASARKYGTGLLETAEAARILAQSGYKADQVIQALNTTLSAARGMGMKVEQVQELQVAIKAVTEASEAFSNVVNWETAVLDKISRVESRYAVTSRDLANSVQLISPMLAQYSEGMLGLIDTFDYTIGMTTVMVEKLRITGTQAAHSLKMIFSRISRPQIAKQLETKFGLYLGDAETGDYLPMDRMLEEMGKKYAQLGGVERKQFANALSGGRNLPQLIVLLENYGQVAQIASEANAAFGDASRRSDIALDTLSTRMTRLRNDFTLFIKHLMDSTAFAEGLKRAVGGLSGVFQTASKEANSLKTVLVGILTIGAAFSMGKGLLGFLGAGARSGAPGMLASLLLMRRSLTGIFRGSTAVAATVGRWGLLLRAPLGFVGLLARMFTPGGILLSGLLLATSLMGRKAKAAKDAKDAAEKYAVSLERINKLMPADSPQAAQFTEAALEAGFGDATVAYETVFNTVTNSHRDMVQTLLKQVPEFTGESARHMQEWRATNEEEFRRLRTEFIKTFIETLPDASKEAFKALKTDSERMALVTKLVSGAAELGVMRMQAAIQEMHEAARRMLDDTMNAYKQIEEAEAKRKGGPTTVVGRIQRRGIGGNYNVLDPQQHARAVYDQLHAYVRQYGSPLDAAFMDHPEFRRAYETRVLTPENLPTLAGKPIAQLLDLVGAVAASDGVTNRTRAVVTFRVNGGTLDDVNNFRAAELTEAGMTPEQVRQLNRQGVWRNMQNDVVGTAANTLRAANARELELQRLAEFLQMGGGAGTPRGVVDSTDKAREAMVRFNNALLDLTTSFYESMTKMRFDDTFARMFDLAYDANEARRSFAQNVLEQVGIPGAEGSIQTRERIDIAKMQAELQEIETIKRDKDQAREESERQRLAREIERREEAFRNTANATLSSVLDTPRGREIMAEFQTMLQGGDITQEKFLELMRRWATGEVREAMEAQRANQRVLTDLELQKDATEKMYELRVAQLPITARVTDQLTLQQERARAMLALDIRALELKKVQRGMGAAEYEEELRKLRVLHRQREVHEAMLNLRQAERTLAEQARTNLQSALSGVQTLLTDLSIWDSIINPEGEDPEAKARNRALAIKNVILTTLNPMFKTIQDRMFDNLFEGLLDDLMKHDTIKSLMESPEIRLAQDLQTAQIYQRHIEMAAVNGATFLMEGVIRGATVGADILASGGAQQGANLALALSGSDGATPGATPGAGGARRAQLMGLAQMGGMIVGNIGGTMLGGGGQGAQMGATIGSTGGMLVGNLILPGIGGVAGGVVGGMLGGMLGGMGDKKGKDNPVVKALDAIERAQRETIATIQIGNDALLKPENRLLNLPSGFNVPGYMPNFGGDGSSGGTSTEINQQNQITINVQGGDPIEVRKAVEEAMANVLDKGRRNSSWGRSAV
jgi:hypothetical protein